MKITDDALNARLNRNQFIRSYVNGDCTSRLVFCCREYLLTCIRAPKSPHLPDAQLLSSEMLIGVYICKIFINHAKLMQVYNIIMNF